MSSSSENDQDSALGSGESSTNNDGIEIHTSVDEEQQHAEEPPDENDGLLSRSIQSEYSRVNVLFSPRLRAVFFWSLVGSAVLVAVFLLIIRFDLYHEASPRYLPGDIYCTGPILHAVQTMNISLDSKDFVDRPMKASPDEVMKAFKTWPNVTNSVVTLIKFIDTYFDPPGSDLSPIVPSDFQDRPPRLYQAIPNETLRDWAMEIHALWKLLGRVPKWEEYPSRHSFLPTQHYLVVPGGRFRESYYWDTYWIVEGLLASEMYTTARGVVQNLLDFVELYGYVPNGGRIYYLTRSQPPMLSDMVQSLDAYEHDLDFLESATRTLDKEYQYWMQQHAVNIQTDGKTHYTLNRYISQATQPRPESYLEDLQTSRKARRPIYGEIIAACESGWDFSSRWLKDSQHLETVWTSNVIPVDLNVSLLFFCVVVSRCPASAKISHCLVFSTCSDYLFFATNNDNSRQSILHRMEKNMIHFHTLLENPEKVDMYEKAAQDRLEAIHRILWDESTSMWRDYWIDSGTLSPVVSASNYFPLWSESIGSQSNITLLKNILDSLRHSGLVQMGGVLTTSKVTGQQWDKPNAWPPIQDILIEGLMKQNITKNYGERLLQAWVHTNWIAYQSNGHFMLEKYNALHPGITGKGGEYLPQVGFGWTNGVLLKLLSKHASLLNDMK